MTQVERSDQQRRDLRPKWLGLAWNGASRLVVFVFGGLLVLQGSESLDAPKLIYLALTALVVLYAAVEVWRSRETADTRRMSPWLAIVAGVLGMLAVSLPVALAHGTGFTPWVRESASYALFGVAPLVAIDAARSLSRRQIARLTIFVGLVAASSFSVYWLQARGIAVLGIDRVPLPSAQLAYAGFAVALAHGLAGRNRTIWAAVAGIVLGLLLITGTRTILLLLAIVPLLVVAAGIRHWRAFVRPVGTMAVSAGLVTVIALSGLNALRASAGTVTPSPQGTSPGPATSAQPTPASTTPAVTPRPDLIVERLGSIAELATNPASQQSLQERITQTRVMLGVFLADPILGTGPGRPYIWTNSSGLDIEAYSLDTPLMIPAEFGLLGIAFVVGLIVVYLRFVQATGRRIPSSPEYLGLVGFGGILALTGALGSPMEDKGAAYALALLLAAVSAATRQQDQDAAS